MKKIFSTYFFPLSISCLWAVMALVLWLGILPLHEQITLQREEIQKLHTARENRSRQLAALSDLRKQFEGIVNEEHVLDILLTDDQIVNFIKIVEEMAKTAEVTVAITAQGQAAAIIERPARQEKATGSAKKLIDEAPFDRYLPLNISVSGPYKNIVLFLHKLETLPIGLDVISMTVEPLAEGARTPEASSRNSSNPFQAALGDASFETISPPLRSSEERLEAKFEVLVYTDRKTK